MTNCIIKNKKSILTGEISGSPSKSQTLRAILFATLADGVSTISNVLDSPDAKAMINACIAFGAKIEYIDINKLQITGTAGILKQPDDIIDAGNSGIVLRFISSIACLLDGYTIITGDHSIRHNRPIKPLLDGLNGLGVFAKSMRGDNYAPIIIKGPVLFNETSLDGFDSQPVSGLIIAATLMSGDTALNVKNPGEKPWLDLTLNWLDRLNIKYTREDYNKFIISGKNKIKAFNYFVPSDLSSIAFPVAAALVTNSNIVINNVDLSDPQGDKILLDIFNDMGANIHYDVDNKKILINKHNGLFNINVNINNCIDSINILSVVACYASGKAVITGAEIARYKECDRITSIYTELKKMGADIKQLPDGLVVNHSKLKVCNNLQTYNDHRMVMALFIASLLAQDNITQSESTIHNIDCVSKSYPSFFIDMNRLGAFFELN